MKLKLALLLTTILPVSFAGAAPDSEKLHSARCTTCHDAGVYTRSDRRVQSLDALRGQINACGHGSGQPLTAEEREAMVRYLNERYYRFQ